VRFAFALPRAAHVRLEVVDAQGRLLREVFAGDLAAGVRSAAWDGCGADGRPVAAGLYFAVVRAGGAAQTRRIAVIR
jgi:hypothetical protein